jgi:hypothetical protein
VTAPELAAGVEIRGRHGHARKNRLRLVGDSSDDGNVLRVHRCGAQSSNMATNRDLTEVRTTVPPWEDPSGRRPGIGMKLGDSSAVPQADRRIMCPDVAAQQKLHPLGSHWIACQRFLPQTREFSDKKVAFARVRELHWPLNSRRFAKVFSSERLELSPEAAAMKRRLTSSLTPIRIVTFVVARSVRWR